MKGHLVIGQAVGVNPASVVLSWSFSTQATEDSLRILGQIVPAQAIAVAATGSTTKQLNPALAGKADVYLGTTAVPYYLAKPANANDRTFLASFWVAAGPPPLPLDQTSRFITRFNPVPVNRGTTTIPLLVTVPNSTANATGGGCTKPAAGWPVAIVQHGLNGDRSTSLAMADSFADACFVVASFDLPLHGITDTASPLYQAANERTFNVDLQNNTTGAPVPDGKIDSTGTHALPTLLSNPLGGRDLLRQGEADVSVVAKSLARLDVTGRRRCRTSMRRACITSACRWWHRRRGAGEILARHPHGHGRRAGRRAHQAAERVGGVRPDGARVGVGNAAPGSTLYANLFREIQTIADPGDPINHICDCVNNKPFHLIKVVADAVVPNSTTDLVDHGGQPEKAHLRHDRRGSGQGRVCVLHPGLARSLFDPTNECRGHGGDAAPVDPVRGLGNRARWSVPDHHQPGRGRAVALDRPPAIKKGG